MPTLRQSWARASVYSFRKAVIVRSGIRIGHGVSATSWSCRRRRWRFMGLTEPGIHKIIAQDGIGAETANPGEAEIAGSPPNQLREIDALDHPPVDRDVRSMVLHGAAA